MQVNISIEAGDVRAFNADVLALKYAQGLHGADAQAVAWLESGGINVTTRLPKVSEYLFVKSEGQIAPNAVLFLGVEKLYAFGYQEIREFGRKVLASLAEVAPETRHVCLTIHGTGYGLDETEVFEAEIAGLLDAITGGTFPEHLERITIVDHDRDTVKRLDAMLSRLLPHGIVELDRKGYFRTLGEKATERLRSVGYASESKPHIFVAMPFAEEMDDIFHYGIKGAVNATGFLCERADLSTFTGDVMERVKKRIASSTLVVADLSTANPNVYLEVGYAWGCGKQTILLVRDAAELKFDVKGQRCLVYKKIKDLEESLRKELEGLRSSLRT
jgi:hypothetical protein